MMKTKTIKTPLMKAVAFGPTSCSSVLVPKSKLLHRPETQYGFVPKHSLHGGKNIALRAEKPYSAMRSFFSEAVFLPLKRLYPCKGNELFFRLWQQSMFLLTKYVTARKRRRCKVDILSGSLLTRKNIKLESYKD